MRAPDTAEGPTGPFARAGIWFRFPALPYTLIGLGVAVFQVSRMVTSNALGRYAFAQDDAYYYFRIAQNIAAGDGSTWDSLHSTNGYHPLWLLALIPFYVVVRGNAAGLVVPKVVAAILWIVDMVQVRAIARVVGAEWTFWIGVLPSAAIAAFALRSPPFNGVETPILLTFLLVSVRLLLVNRLLSGDEPGGTTGIGRVWLTGVAFALVVLSRLDAASVVGLFGLAVVVRMVQRRRSARDVVRTAIALAGPTAIALVVYMALNQALFDSPIPVSGRAKALPGPAGGWPDMEAYFRNGLGIPGPIGPGIAATAVVALVALSLWATRARGVPTEERRRMVELSALVGLAWIAGMLLVAYYDRTSSWKLLSWYYYAATLVLLLGPGVVVANAFAWWHRFRKQDQPAPAAPRAVRWDALAIPAAIAVIVLAVAAGFVTRVDARGDEDFFVQSAAIARELDGTLPRSAVLAMGDRAGAFGYELDRPVVSIEGIVNDTDYLHALQDGRVHEALRRAGADYYVRSINTKEERNTTGRDIAGAWSPPEGCGRRAEPLYGVGPKTWFRVCTDDVVFTTDPDDAETLTVWRYPPSPVRTAARLRADAALEPLLPTVDELPANWVRGVSRQHGADETDGFCGGPNLVARAEAQGVTGLRRVEFVRERGSRRLLGLEVYAFPDDAAAQAVMDASAAAAAACPSMPVRDDEVRGYRGALRTEPLPFPDVADETLALRQRLHRPDDSELTYDVVHVRDGRLVFVVTVASRSGDAAAAERFVALQLARLRAGTPDSLERSG